jgi:uncharacterized membrane protein
MLWANLIFLFCLSLFPFATDWIGVKGLSSFSTALYAAVSILPGLAYMALWLAVRARSTVPPHATWAKMGTSTTLYLLAIPAAYVRPVFALGFIVLVAIVWVLPPKAEAANMHESRR